MQTNDSLFSIEFAVAVGTLIQAMHQRAIEIGRRFKIRLTEHLTDKEGNSSPPKTTLCGDDLPKDTSTRT